MKAIRRAQRVEFYARGVLRDLIPYAWFGARRKRLFEGLSDGVLEKALARVRYYNKLSRPQSPLAAAGAIAVGALKAREHSYYYYDFKRYAKAFGARLLVHRDFGDNTAIPAVPTLLKSRPIAEANQNAVVMKLDSLRHFTTYADGLRFADKKPTAVWRGILGRNSTRARLAELYQGDPRFDIGFVGPVRFGLKAASQRLSIDDQLQYRYILSIEGNDVATNLKWIMASNSLCLMPAPKFETWFMEGTLQPGVHYVSLAPDLGDLPEKVDHYNRHPEEAEAIIANANLYVAGFKDPATEELISLLVLQKYFESTGQIAAARFSERLFGS